jgi:hypothetical protein
MVIESFLIFLSTLISINANTDAQGQQTSAPTETHKKVVRQVPQNTDLCRGGWDRN